MTICLVSLLPCPLIIGLYSLDDLINSYTEDTFPSTITSILYDASYTLLQCIEEICLLLCSEDFRKLVKKQFIKNKQTAVVNTKIVITVNVKETLMRQLNA